MKILKHLLEHPWFNLMLGLIIAASAGWEIYTEIQEGMEDVAAGAHHGIALLGVVQILRALPDLTESFELATGALAAAE